ncbi:astacin-like metalloprotease toxin 5, partial [Hyalella azteca]|uniref:Metalloendopeptidase n=1 Tax=Hyalella azteca TaxID=294128 RepID=A0A8B7P0J6_HYAAZ
MLYSAEQWNSFLDKNLASMESLWPKKNGVVKIFYKISDPGVNTTAANLAIAAWEAKTCIKFSKMTESDERAEYMKIWLDKSCYADVGHRKGKPTKVSLANCPERGPTHEIGHALGMKHEQARSDRDDNIIVYMANIKPGMENNYDKFPTINFEVPYDYYSLMQYHDRSFGIDDKRVMLAKDVRFQILMGDGDKITHWNAKLMNTMYKCTVGWLKACKQKSEPCKNGGYTQKDCSCACPLGTSGDKCENLVMSYRDALIKQFSPYTSVISTSGAVVVSPGYPDKAPST